MTKMNNLEQKPKYCQTEVERILFMKIHDRIDAIYEQMEKEIPFMQPYNSLYERKDNLLQALIILEKEWLL